jgi:hypothetical protein
MPALGAGIHVFMRSKSTSWMAGSSPAMTTVKVPVQQRIISCCAAPGTRSRGLAELGRIKPRRENKIA